MVENFNNNLTNVGWTNEIRDAETIRPAKNKSQQQLADEAGARAEFLKREGPTKVIIDV